MTTQNYCIYVIIVNGDKINNISKILRTVTNYAQLFCLYVFIIISYKT